MKKLLLVTAAFAAALGASLASATVEPVAAHNKLDAQEIHDSYVIGARATREAFNAARGTYALDDGTTLRLYQSGDAIIAAVSGQAPLQVRATREGNFVAVDGNASFKFVQNAGGQVEGVVVTRNS
jgi:opacity protein-like surface antigen